MFTGLIRKGLERREALRKLLGGSVAAAAAVVTGARAVPAVAQQASMGSIKNLGICVMDAERSKKFYTEVFGFTAESKPTKVGPALGALLELEGLDMTIQFIDTGSVRLELFQYASPKAMGDGKRRGMNQLGFTHIQIKVADLKTCLDAVKRNGGAVQENAKLMRGDALSAIFVTDPDGTRIELVP